MSGGSVVKKKPTKWESRFVELKAKLDEHAAHVDLVLEDIEDKLAVIHEQHRLLETRLIGLAKGKRRKIQE